MIDTTLKNKIINLAFMAQFVNFLEFVLISPLSPFFTEDLGIQTSEVGWILGAYSLSAAISGIISSIYIDSYDRKKVLLICFAGMLFGTLTCILSNDFTTLIISRIIAGIFGGPATAITIAILSDFVPNHERGKAIGRVMVAFPLASIIGAPGAIEIAHIYGWRISYTIVLLFEVISILLILKNLPNITEHIQSLDVCQRKLNKIFSLLCNKDYTVGFAAAFLVFFSFFVIVPNIANLMIYNFNLPPKYLSVYFFIGGLGGFLLIKLVGWICDKYSSTFSTFIMTILFIIALLGSHIFDTPNVISWIFMALIVMSVSPRNTATSVATSKLPKAHDRAGFLSIQNAAQNIAASFGGFASGAILVQGPQKELIGIEIVAIIAIIISLTIPYLISKIESITNLD